MSPAHEAVAASLSGLHLGESEAETLQTLQPQLYSDSSTDESLGSTSDIGRTPEMTDAEPATTGFHIVEAPEHPHPVKKGGHQLDGGAQPFAAHTWAMPNGNGLNGVTTHGVTPPTPHEVQPSAARPWTTPNGNGLNGVTTHGATPLIPHDVVEYTPSPIGSKTVGIGVDVKVDGLGLKPSTSGNGLATAHHQNIGYMPASSNVAVAAGTGGPAGGPVGSTPIVTGNGQVITTQAPVPIGSAESQTANNTSSPPTGPRLGPQTTPPLHAQSVIWVSPQEEERGRFVSSILATRNAFPRSPFLPNTFNEWCAHRSAMLYAEARQAARRLHQLHVARVMGRAVSAVGTLQYPENRGGVLAQETMWRVSPESEELPPSAEWPSQQEMKWEGDDRARTNVSRFPPLPRESGNGTVAWHLRNMVAGHPFDEVRKVPTADEVLLSQFEEEVMPKSLINSDLWAAINDDW